MKINVDELEGAERLIESIDRNEFHPANDRTHKDHRQTARVLRLLKIKVAESRANLDAELLFKNVTLNVTQNVTDKISSPK